MPLPKAVLSFSAPARLRILVIMRDTQDHYTILRGLQPERFSRSTQLSRAT